MIEAYMMVDVEGTGTATLHRILKAGNALLEVEEVDRKPFIAFCPLPIPHSFYGSNFADRLCSTQNARTVLTRSILDHAMITNNPRYMVTKGGLTNPRELIDNRVGGLVNVTRPDAIVPMPQASLNPFVFQTLQELQDNLEETSSISSLTTGMNKDAVSKQNSAALVEQLATMSQQRQKIIARNFAAHFVKPLFHEVYRLVVENEQAEKVVDIAGSFVPIDPRSWKEKRDVMVELKLGYGEQDREAAKLMQMHQMFSQDPAVQPMYGLPNRHALLKKMLEQQGILNVDEYLTPPEQIPPPQPDPAQQMQVQMAAKQLDCKNGRQLSRKPAYRSMPSKHRQRWPSMPRRQLQATRCSPTTKTSARNNSPIKSVSTKANSRFCVGNQPMFEGLLPQLANEKGAGGTLAGLEFGEE